MPENLFGGKYNYMEGWEAELYILWTDKVEEAAKKNILLMAGPLRGGEGAKGWAIKGKRSFFETLFLFCCQVPTAIKLGGSGGGRP